MAKKPSKEVGSPASDTIEPPSGERKLAEVIPPDPGEVVEGFYDIRRGASGYSQIVATFGALAGPTVFIVFAAMGHDGPLAANPRESALAAGLLVVALQGALGGSIAMAALGAERRLTGNLAKGSMWAGAGVVVAATSLFGSFAVVATVMAPDTARLFVGLELAGGAFGIIFVAFAIADSWALGPRDPRRRESWRESQWIKTHEMASRESLKVSIAGLGPILLCLGIVLVNWRLSENDASQIAVVLAGMALAFLSPIMAAMTTRHRPEPQAGLGWKTAYITVLLPSTYVVAVALVVLQKVS